MSLEIKYILVGLTCVILGIKYFIITKNTGPSKLVSYIQGQGYLGSIIVFLCGLYFIISALIKFWHHYH